MPPAILSSPFLTLPILDKALANPSLSPLERISLLHAKITLLTNDISSALTPTPSSQRPPSSSRDTHTTAGGSSSVSRSLKAVHRDLESTLKELECRKDVATLYLSLGPSKYIEAEGELTIVEGRCKSLLKRQRDREKKGQDGLLDDGMVRRIIKLRVEGLRLLVRVEEGLGRDGRAKRWKELADVLEQ